MNAAAQQQCSLATAPSIEKICNQIIFEDVRRKMKYQKEAIVRHVNALELAKKVIHVGFSASDQKEKEEGEKSHSASNHHLYNVSAIHVTTIGGKNFTRKYSMRAQKTIMHKYVCMYECVRIR